MDPISIIGTAGSVANIIEVVAKTINTIRKIVDKYKEADLRFLTLVSQLTALRAAFNKIYEWMNSDLVDDPYHQLVMDLDVVLSCCRLLVGRIESMLNELHEEDDGKLDVPSRVKLVFSEKNLDGLQKLIEQQTGALTLLLTACNCKTLSDQKTLLEKSSTRRVVRRMEADTASLFVHRDTDSFMSQMTDRLSKLSVVFTFDRELFISKVYERALRGSLKKSLKMENKDPTKRSQAIDQMLEEDARRLRRECKVLILGTAESGKNEIIKHMKLIHPNGYSEEELRMYRSTIYKTLMDSVKALISVMRHLEIEPEKEENKALCTKLMEYNIPVDPDTAIDKTIGDAISSVWSDPCISRLLEHSAEFYFRDIAPYFFNEVKRITSSDYVPIEADVLRAKTRPTGINEIKFNMGQLSIHMFDVSGKQSERKKWIHAFENISSIIFVINLADYGEVLLEDSNQNRMTESMILFDSVVNSRWFMRTSIILFLSNVAEFKEKLSSSPLSNYFPDYNGGNDVNRAAKYLLGRFNQLNRAKLNMYPHLVQPSDISNIRLVFAAVKETLLQNAIRSNSNFRLQA